MDNQLRTVIFSSEPPPVPRSGFERDVIREVELLVGALPAGTAQLEVSRAPGHPEWPEPHFGVIPKNTKAAPFRGAAVASDLNLTIGEAAWREFYGFARGGTIVRGATWREELRLIWFAVVAGGFTERVYRNSRGKAIGSATKLLVNGKELVIRNGRRAERLLQRQRVESITYEPYA